MAPQLDMHDLHLRATNILIAVPSAFIILIFFYISGWMIYNTYFHPLSSFPGPKSYAASRISYISALLSGTLPYKCQELRTIYGEVVRNAPDEFSFANANAWKDIYGHHQGHPQMPKDPKFYARPATGVDHLITANQADHSRFRRLVSHAFSEKALREQEPVIKSYVDLLIQRLNEQANNGHASVDMVPWYNWTTFDVIGDLAFGQSFDCLANSSYHPWVNMLFKHVKGRTFLTAANHFPGVRSILTLFLPKSLVKSRQEHMNLTIEKVVKRLELGTSRPDFMSHILRHNDEKGMTVPEIIANANLLILAGSDITATLLSGATYHLLRNPRVMHKLVEEIRNTFAAEDEITMTSVNGLAYMLAVLDEAFRMYPPVPSGLPRCVPEGGAPINGKWVPGGDQTAVSVNQWSNYHSPDNFRDAESFIPERFLDDARCSSDKRTALQPFHIGPRNCIGRNLAYAEISLILARVLRNFDMELTARSENWTDQKIYSLWEKGPLQVKLSSTVKE